MIDAARIIETLDLKPHPEGGHFAETWRAPAEPGKRSAGTAIYYLLQAGEVSHWHRVDAAEAWHWYAGAALELALSPEGRGVTQHQLSADIVSDARPQLVIPAGFWQSARSLGDWTLVGCTVSPGFEFSGFEMAPAGWQPGSN
ncbi:MAG: cupin domain-containing protein [Anderseniella sp.]